ncbi:ABC transporter permease [Sphingomonas sp. G-3-2-10]|uniref:ABC transporter permease subunit n=1 Tax=Sphingomonas sp. G-3-2-10 TaxID=2728838 RepID=UPI00146CC702|nr:ABC transporter permease [Sphingomonas sp. G-3-2-10]NML07725.1 ABC transporter permease subunit [Sphingomonas sp. G-3-2-10]
MRNLVSAEWTKMLPHKGTWMLVWIYPALFFVVLTIAIFAEGKNPDAMTAKGWIDDTTMIWYTPTITLGRYFIAAYFALVFAGEYGWNTWKLVVPHAARWKLVASKYLVALGLLYIAWIATALLSIVMQYVRTAIVGEAVPAGVTFGALLNGHLSLMVLGIAPLLIAATYASLVAVLTRSTLAAFIVSLVLITLDELYGKIVLWLSTFGMEWPAALYRVLPGYHLDNLSSWIRTGAGFQYKLATGTVIACSQTVSLLALAAWIAGLAGLTFFAFRRQDIN